MYHRVNKEELDKFLEKQTIPITDTRINLFKKSIENIKVNGMYMEFGVYSGGTINSISNIIPDKTVYGFDSWLGLPDDYSEGYPKGTFLREIPKNFNPNVELVIGVIQNTLSPFLTRHPEKIAFLHMDVDIYSATKFVLDILAHRLQVGTVIQFDEIFDCQKGYWYTTEFEAWNEFVKENNIKWEYVGWIKSMHCSYIITNIGKEV